MDVNFFFSISSWFVGIYNFLFIRAIDLGFIGSTINFLLGLFLGVDFPTSYVTPFVFFVTMSVPLMGVFLVWRIIRHFV